MKIRLRIGNGDHQFSGDPKALKTLMAIIAKIAEEGTREEGFRPTFPTKIGASVDITYPGVGSVRVWRNESQGQRNEYEVIFLQGRLGSWLSNL